MGDLCHHHFVNAAVWWFRSRPEIAENPALKWGYRKLIRGCLIYGNIPWLILGAAFELPRAFRGPLFIAFAATVVVYWIAGFYWLAFGGGAEDLAAHPGILKGSVRDPWTIKAQVLSIMALPSRGWYWSSASSLSAEPRQFSARRCC